MEQLRKLIRKTLLENFLTQEDLERTKRVMRKDAETGKKAYVSLSSRTLIQSEQWAAEMMEKGADSNITIGQNAGGEFAMIANTLELLIDAYKQGAGIYKFPNSNIEVPIDKSKIEQSINGAILGTSNEDLKFLVNRTTGTNFTDEQWFEDVFIGGKNNKRLIPNIDKAKATTFEGDIVKSTAGEKFSQYSGGAELGGISKIKYIISKYINEELSKQNSFFLNSISFRLKSAVLKNLSEMGMASQVSAITGKAPETVQTVSYDAKMGGDGEDNYLSRFAGENPAEFELSHAREKTAEEKYASLDLINHRVYEAINNDSPVRGEIFRLRVIGETSEAKFAKTTKKNTEIRDMFFDKLLSEPTEKNIQDFLNKKISIGKIPPQDSLDYERVIQKEVLDKINQTFKDTKDSALKQYFPLIKSLMIQEYGKMQDDELNERASAYISRVFGEKKGEKGEISKEKRKINTEDRKSKALTYFFVFKKMKINSLLNTLQNSDSNLSINSIQEFFSNDNKYNSLKNTYPDFPDMLYSLLSEKFLDVLFKKQKSKDAGETPEQQNEKGREAIKANLDDIEAMLRAEFGNPDELEFANKSSDLDSDLYEEQTITEASDDNYKFDTSEFVKLADELAGISNRGELYEMRKIVRKFLIANFLK